MTWFRLEALLYLLPLSILLGTNIPFLSVGGRDIAIGTNELLLAALLIGLLIRHLRGEADLVIPRRLLLGILGYSLALPASLIAVQFTHANTPSLASWIEVIRWGEYLIVLIAILMLVRSEVQVYRLLGLILVGALANLAVGLYQAATLNFSEARIYGLFVSAANRANTTVSNPNVIGAFFACCALFFLAYGLNGKPRVRGAYMALVFPTVAAMALSLSRSAMLGFLLGMAVQSLFFKKHRLKFLAAGIVIVVALVVVVFSSGTLLTRLINTFLLVEGTVDAGGVQDRFYGWRMVLGQFWEAPVLGIGYWNLYPLSTVYTADNLYIETLGTSGILGFVSLISIFWEVLRNAWRFRPAPESFASTYRAAFIASMIAFLAANVTGALLYNNRLLGLFWLSTGLMLQIIRLERARARSLGVACPLPSCPDRSCPTP